MGSKTVSTASIKDVHKVCRLCLSEKYLEDIFEQEDLPKWISEYLSIEISANDDVSKLVCVICSARLKEFRDFQRSCQEIQNILKKEASKNQIQDEDQSQQTRKKLNDHKRLVDGPRSSRLKAHMVKHIDEQLRLDCISVVKKPAIQTNPPDPLQCEVCHKIYQTKKQMGDHRRLVHGLKKHVCSICSKSFVQRLGLEKHIATHNNGRSLKTSFNATILAKRASVPVKNSEDCSYTSINKKVEIKCDECGKIFDIRRKLWDHRRMVHGPKKQKCPFCDKAFVTRRDMEKHLTVHRRQITKDELRKYHNVQRKSTNPKQNIRISEELGSERMRQDNVQSQSTVVPLLKADYEPTNLENELLDDINVMEPTAKDERKSPIQKVACTICNQLIHPSLTSLKEHLKTHEVVEIEGSSEEEDEIFELEEIEVEPNE